MKISNYLKTRWQLQSGVVFLLVILLLLASLASVFWGVKNISGHKILALLFLHPTEQSLLSSIVCKRIVRMAFGLLCGAALGVSGVLMQAVTRNPLADPSILGINTGASFFVVCGIAFFKISTAGQYVIVAFVGALAAAGLVFGIVALGKRLDALTLLLAGTGVSMMFSSLVTIVILVKQEAMDQFRFWQVGSLGSASVLGIKAFVPVFLLSLILAVACAPGLDALMLGNEVAQSLGVNAVLISLTACLAGIALCATATALAGPIAFIGLLATHFTRLLFGSEVKKVLPLSALVGALFLTTADVIGRSVSNTAEISVGIITALVGAPVLIFLARRMKVRAL